jgi:NitT/TauT family transport system permease protein
VSGRARSVSVPAAAPAAAEDWLRDRRTLRDRLLSRANIDRAITVFSPLFLLGLWQIATLAGMVDTRFFPAPSTILVTFGEMVRSGEIWNCQGTFFESSWCAGVTNIKGGHLGVSLFRMAVGFTLGAVPGIVIGLAMGLFSPVRAAIQPLIDATFPIPKIAILPLFIMIFGIGEESKYAIIASAVIYLVLINTVAGVRNIEKIYLDVGKNYHLGRRLMFTDVALPGAMPLIVTGLKLGMGVALLVIVAAEFVGAKSGIGYLVWTSWQVFQVEKMYVGLLISAVLGFSLAVLLTYLERVLVPWRR